MDSKAIKAEIKAVKKEMREQRVRRISCFNGGLTSTEYRYNSQLFALETKLLAAEKQPK